MIMAMLDIDASQESILVVVLQPENLIRMQHADQATLESINRGGILPPPLYPKNLSMLVAYEENAEELQKRLEAGNVIRLVQWLERGRQFVDGLDGKENIQTVKMHWGGRGTE
jgi:hypothetical protein